MQKAILQQLVSDNKTTIILHKRIQNITKDKLIREILVLEVNKIDLVVEDQEVEKENNLSLNNNNNNNKDLLVVLNF